MIEEYLTGFGPAMSRLFDISWTERSFLLVFAFMGPIIYLLTALGLYRRSPLAGFAAWFIFIGPGVAEFNTFISIGRAHVCTQVTTAHLVFLLLLDNNTIHIYT